MTVNYVVQDLGDGAGLDLLDGDYNGIEFGLSPSEVADKLEELSLLTDDEVEVVMPDMDDTDLPLPLEDAVYQLREEMG